MKIQNLCRGGWSSNCFYVTDDAEKYAVIIDPSVPPSFLNLQGIKPSLVAILLTHAHFDHIIALEAWRSFGAPVMVAAPDAKGLLNANLNVSDLFGQSTTYPPADKLLYEGDSISFGDCELHVLTTPGHTPGSCCFVSNDIVFSGDTLFANGGYGRFDLPGGSYDALCASLDKLFRLNGEYTVYPGHGPATTLSHEKILHGK